MRSILRGALVGACAGLAVLVADLLTAGVAHGRRFAPTPECLELLGIVALFCAVPGALLGALAALLLRGRGPRPWWIPPAVLVLATGGLALLRPHSASTRESDGIAGTASAARRPDVLWITVDTLRADGLYGDPSVWTGSTPGMPGFEDAPHIGALAHGGTVFTQSEATSGWTIPSTASLLTGRHPSVLGARNGYLAGGAKTVAELLGAAGWRTVAHVDNALLDEVNGFAAGFQRFEKRIPMEFVWSLTTSRLLPASFRASLRHRMPISYAGAKRLVDGAIADVTEASDAPLFLYVHAMDPHAPYWSTPEGPARALVARKLPDLDTTGRRVARRDPDFLDADEKDAIRALYRAEVRTVDREIGRLLRRFDEARGLENAIVIVTADHGEEFWEHGRMGHGHALWNEVVHVPLIFHVPRTLVQEPDPLVATPVSGVDVLPTLADLLGLEVDGEPPAFDGRSLVPALRGKPLEPLPLHAELFRFHRTLHRWREGDLVLVRGHLPDDKDLLRLFDLACDPTEAHDLAAERPDDVQRLGADLDGYLGTLERGGVGSGDSQTYFEGLNRLGY